MAAPAEPRRPSIFAAKAGFVIPKNRLAVAASLVTRGGAKNEPPAAAAAAVAKEDNPQSQRSTKWGLDLTLDPAVRKSRALAYQTRVDQITKVLNSGALEVGGNEGSMSTSTGLNSDAASNLKENELEKFALLELEKQEIIGQILQLNPGYKAPDDYKPLLKETKVPLHEKAHPWHNIIGVLIGPESNTQKRLQEETGANIRVYGTMKANGEKGEVRQPDIKEAQAAYEDLYINVSADSYDKVDAAVALIELLLTPVSVNSADASTTPNLISPAITSGSVNPAAAQLVQSATSHPSLIQYQSQGAHWLSTTQTNVHAIPSSVHMLSSLPSKSFQTQPPAVSFSMFPYTGHPPHTNVMPRNPLPVPGPQSIMPSIQHPSPQFQANPAVGPPFGRPPTIISPQPMLSSSSGPLPAPLQTPHISGGWTDYSPVTVQPQRPSQAAPSFMPVRPPISVSPIAATPPLQVQGAVPSVPQSNISTNYGAQHPPGANFTPTLPSRPPGGPRSFASFLPQGPSSVQVLSSPAGASSQSPHPHSMQMHPPMSTPQMRGPPSSFPQVGPTPGMVHLPPSHLPATLGMSGLSSLASANSSYSQTSMSALRPPRPTTGDFTFRPLVPPLPAADLPASACQMGTHANNHVGLTQAPLFHPGFQRPLDGSLMGQPRMPAPPPQFPGSVPWKQIAPQSPAGFQVFPPAAQSGASIIPPPMPPSSSLPHRPFHPVSPQQDPFINTARQGGNPGGINPIYDPFAPTVVSGGANKTDADPEYEDLMASVGVK